MDKGSNDSNQFSAEDIRRYHAGEMPAHEMHAMEKAALEDPFLADAIEGYTYTVTANKDLEELRSKLLEKDRGKKIISLPGRRSYYAPLKVAALVLLLAGAGWIVYQFSLAKENDVALNNVELKETDTVQSAAPALTTDSLYNKIAAKEKESNGIASGKKRSIEKDVSDQSSQNSPLQKTEVLTDKNQDVASVQNQTTAFPAIASRSPNIRLLTANLPDSATVFKGRIVNAEDKPVPYATINISDNRKDVLTDAQGNFSIATPDSILKANVSAAGYLTYKLNLNNSQENHKVVLQESNQSLQEVVVTGIGQPRRREMAKQSATAISDLEPVDGFKKYNEYLFENIKKSKGTNKNTVNGEVVLMFDVTDNGMPVNITVEKSLCSYCDEEAIRLLMEGPKWQKKQNKKGKIAITF